MVVWGERGDRCTANCKEGGKTFIRIPTVTLRTLAIDRLSVCAEAMSSCPYHHEGHRAKGPVRSLFFYFKTTSICHHISVASMIQYYVLQELHMYHDTIILHFSL